MPRAGNPDLWHCCAMASMLGTLETPDGRTLWVGDDLVIRRRTDPDTGVESVEGHRLER